MVGVTRVKRGALAILQLQSELYQLALHTASRELAYQRVRPSFMVLRALQYCCQ